jgi:putative transcription factor
MICELCGQDVPFLKPLLVEGSILKVCQNCSKFGKEAPGTPKTFESPEPSTGGHGNGDGYRGMRSYGYTATPPSKEEVIKRRLEQRERRRSSKDIYEQSGEKELAMDYHRRIQQARSNLGWSQEELGQKINERKSVISKIENKSMTPDDRLVRKLEKALGIKLMEVIE